MSIADACLVKLAEDRSQFKGSAKNLSEALEQELGVSVTAAEIESAGSLSQLSALLQPRLFRNASGKTLLDLYVEIERMAKEEYHPKIHYDWCAKWNDFFHAGNWLTRPDELDSVEMLIRIEDKYGMRIPDEDAAAMTTVGQTVRYVWAGSKCERNASRSPESDTARSYTHLGRRITARLFQNFGRRQ